MRNNFNCWDNCVGHCRIAERKIKEFEKEAEEYCGNLDESKTRDFIRDAFKDGAEFGYKKINEQAKQLLKKWLQDKTYTPKQHNELVKETKNFIGE